MFSAVIPTLTTGPTVVPSTAPTLTAVPSAPTTAAPSTRKPSSAPTYLIQDCSVVDCSVFWGSMFTVVPGQIVARFYLPAEFQINFAVRRPILSSVDNNLFALRAANAPEMSESLLTFSLESQAVSTVSYNGNLLQGPGVVTDYTTSYTSFSLMYHRNTFSLTSSAAPGTTTIMAVPGLAVNTTGTLFYLYASAPGSVDVTTLRPILQSFTVGGKKHV